MIFEPGSRVRIPHRPDIPGYVLIENAIPAGDGWKLYVEETSGSLRNMPDDAYYDATHPEECFATPQDAEAAGYRAAKV